MKRGCNVVLVLICLVLLFGVIRMVRFFDDEGWADSKTVRFFDIPEHQLFLRFEERAGYGWRLYFADSLWRLEIDPKWIDWVFFSYNDLEEQIKLCNTIGTHDSAYDYIITPHASKIHSIHKRITGDEDGLGKELVAICDTLYIKVQPIRKGSSGDVSVVFKSKANEFYLDTIPLSRRLENAYYGRRDKDGSLCKSIL